ncbi:imidazole glycerol phosphate synthase subunit HisF [Candidatus Micrarchaeota archaeon]|nr:imidazole glycerol phosphate synthase subunit HisF [Candidatus Micrarchaeota archaeon]
MRTSKSPLCKRIIPCLDVKNGRVVKGTNFVGLKDAGDPIELARKYYEDGADELVFLDITASSEGRNTVVELAKAVAQEVFIPFTIGGGIRTIKDIEALLKAGADKVSINTAAIVNPKLLTDAACEFGNQAIVIAIDAKQNESGSWNVYKMGGCIDTNFNAMEWAKKAVSLGAGEVLLTSMDRDGTQSGFDIELTRAIVKAVNVPVIASGGGGKVDDFINVFQKTNVSAALAAGIFHYGKITIGGLKKELKLAGVDIREI